MTVNTECAQCFTAVKVNTEAPSITVRVPSSAARGGALRGKNFEPARTVTVEATFDSDSTLVLWDCPVCDYADSTYADSETRRVLS